MRYNTVIFIVLGALVLGGLFVVFKPKTSPSITQSNQQDINTNQNKSVVKDSVTQQSPLPNIFELVIQGKKLVSGPATIKVNQGDEVTINISSDEAEVIHFHGYNQSLKLEPNTKATLSFTANLSGRFPFELENSNTEIGALEVQPK